MKWQHHCFLGSQIITETTTALLVVYWFMLHCACYNILSKKDKKEWSSTHDFSFLKQGFRFKQNGTNQSLLNHKVFFQYFANSNVVEYCSRMGSGFTTVHKNERNFTIQILTNWNLQDDIRCFVVPHSPQLVFIYRKKQR